MVTPVAADDSARYRILQMLNLLNAEPDPALDRLTRIAAASTQMPIALLSFVGPDGYWIPSRVGVDLTFLALQDSFCRDALARNELLEVRDTQADPQFSALAVVTGPLGIRFYAGHPIAFEGTLLGTISVLDRVPRALTPADCKVMADLAGMVGDLLRLRHDEQALQHSEERYRRIVETAAEGVWMIDPQAITTFANPKMAEMLGCTVDEMLGHSVFEFFDEEFAPTAREKLQRRARGISEQHDFRFRRKDGSQLWASLSTTPIMGANGRFDGALAMLTDITQRKAAEDALRDNEARFRALAALSSDWFWELDRDLRLTVLSGGSVGPGQRDLQALIGMKPWEVPEADLSSADWATHRQHLEDHQPFRDFELQHRRQDGEHVIVCSVTGEPVFDAAKRFVGYRGVGRDISEQKRAQAARRELATQLRESQKMEAIGVLAGGIAHDFNNVLAGILGNAALALEDLAPDHPVVSLLQQIYKSGLRGRDLVKQILTFARRQPQELADCALRPLIEETIALLRATLPAGVAIDAVFGDEPHVLADATQIEQVLMNLCTNAWHALQGQPGRIDVGLEVIAVEPAQGRGTASLVPGLYAHLWVSDTGQGMNATTRARIFEPFFTTKAVGEGTGLGLSVAHGIVVTHGGAISVDTEPEAGSTFHVYLPVNTSVAPAERSGETLPPTPQGNGEHVMYIDDDDVMVVMVDRYLNRLGYRVTAYQEVREAVAALRAQPETIDIVVTDFNMPGLSGLDVAEVVAELRPDLPVIISSGNFPPELQDVSRRAGVRALMQKQHTLDELGSLIHFVLAGGQRISRWADLMDGPDRPL